MNYGLPALPKPLGDSPRLLILLISGVAGDSLVSPSLASQSLVHRAGLQVSGDGRSKMSSLKGTTQEDIYYQAQSCRNPSDVYVYFASLHVHDAAIRKRSFAFMACSFDVTPRTNKKYNFRTLHTPRSKQWFTFESRRLGPSLTTLDPHQRISVHDHRVLAEQT